MKQLLFENLITKHSQTAIGHGVPQEEVAGFLAELAYSHFESAKRDGKIEEYSDFTEMAIAIEKEHNDF